jgi:hypothetical protein
MQPVSRSATVAGGTSMVPTPPSLWHCLRSWESSGWPSAGCRMSLPRRPRSGKEPRR